MNEVDELIESGVLELYVMGSASSAQARKVERMAKAYRQVRNELNSIEISLEQYALSQARAVDPTIRPFLMATVAYMERIGKGEQPAFPPQLHASSLITDYDQWLKRPDLVLTQPLEEIEAHIIGSTPQMTTAVVWIRSGSPPEIHTKEYESFLIVEGTCNIIVDGKDNHLIAGQFFTIPLHLEHMVIVTSQIPCKVILQRLAA